MVALKLPYQCLPSDASFEVPRVDSIDQDFACFKSLDAHVSKEIQRWKGHLVVTALT